jgi:hypothetical protein
MKFNKFLKSTFKSTYIKSGLVGTTIKLWFIRGALLVQGTFMRTKRKRAGIQSFLTKGLLIKYKLTPTTLTFFLINFFFFEKVLFRIGISKYHAISKKKHKKDVFFPLMLYSSMPVANPKPLLSSKKKFLFLSPRK